MTRKRTVRKWDSTTALQVVLATCLFFLTGQLVSAVEEETFVLATTESIAPLLRVSLEADLGIWRDKEQARGAKLTAGDVLAMAHAWASWQKPPRMISTHKLVLIWNNRWIHVEPYPPGPHHPVLTQNLCTEVCPPKARGMKVAVDAPHKHMAPGSNAGGCYVDKCQTHLAYIATTMSKLLRSGTIQLPNALFLLNVQDNSHRECAPSNNCSVPTFALIKGWADNNATDRDTDILVPQMQWTPKLSHLPWSNKSDTAFWRGRNYCGSTKGRPVGWRRTCTRRYFSHMSYRKPELDMDVGLVNSHRPQHTNVTLIEGKGKVAFEDHVRYKYLLHLEGVSASSRLGQLMTTDSLVLRAMESNLTEHYYRALVPCDLLALQTQQPPQQQQECHYVPFFVKHKNDLIQVLQQLRAVDKEQPGKLEAVGKMSNKFAATYLTMGAKVRYWVEAITAYTKLFEDMDAGIQQALRSLGVTPAMLAPPR